MKFFIFILFRVGLPMWLRMVIFAKILEKQGYR